MPSFKTIEEAERYGIKNYFEPKIKESIYGNFTVYDEWNLRKR